MAFDGAYDVQNFMFLGLCPILRKYTSIHSHHRRWMGEWESGLNIYDLLLLITVQKCFNQNMGA